MLNCIFAYRQISHFCMFSCGLNKLMYQLNTFQNLSIFTVISTKQHRVFFFQELLGNH